MGKKILNIPVVVRGVLVAQWLGCWTHHPEVVG